MIDNAMTAGCLRETIEEIQHQEQEQMKFFRWLAHGHGMSWDDFWKVKKEDG